MSDDNDPMLTIVDEPMVTTGTEHIQVKFNGDRWWQMPSEKSAELLMACRSGKMKEKYTWTWTTRQGTYTSHYVIDFTNMQVTNIHSERVRCIRFVNVRDTTADAMQKMSLDDATPSSGSVQVAWGEDMWWQMPPHLSTALLELYEAKCHEASYVWDWMIPGWGTFWLEGQCTQYNRYTINFSDMYQRNSDTENERRIQIFDVVDPCTCREK